MLTFPAFDGMCQRNTIYFNQTFTDPIFRIGNVTIYQGLLGLAKLVGEYSLVQGYSASGEEIGFATESCASAAMNVDPVALA